MTANPRSSNDFVREALRRGDPARDPDVPSPAGFAVMRQRVLAWSAGQPGERRASVWVPVTALAAVIVVSIVGVFMLRKTPATGPTTAPLAARVPVQEAVSPWPPVPGPALTPGRAIGERDQVAEVVTRRSGSGAGRRARPAVTPSPPAAADPPRQLQFTTAGGTRIVWVLTR
jgi:hypothetical protein